MEILSDFWGIITGYITFGNILILAASVLGYLAARTGLGFITEIREVIVLYRKAKDPESPGGEDLTKEEKQQIRDQIGDTFLAIWEKYSHTVWGGILSGFQRIKNIFT